MTYRPESDTESLDRPALSEIEITPEMLAAASLELARFNRDYATIEQGAARILEAALSARGT
jgi:hypothetical protein